MRGNIQPHQINNGFNPNTQQPQHQIQHNIHQVTGNPHMVMKGINPNQPQQMQHIHPQQQQHQQ